MSSLGRTISTRVPKNPDATSHTAKPAKAQWTGPSQITIFLRSLRLLNLDLLEDWPDLSESAYSGRVAQQNLRVKGTEWALYRLFEIWDPETAQHKLKPFFPPISPLQSKNLRAALFRALTDLKRDGVLEKEVILRKTMLDECKGEKFEEIVSSFSMSVLRKVARQSKLDDDYFITAALESLTGDQQNNSHLLPMMLTQHFAAKKYLLASTVIQDEYSLRMDKLEHRLEVVEEMKGELHKQAKIVSHISKSERDESAYIASRVENEWDGDQRWVQAVVSSSRTGKLANEPGDPHSADDTATLLEDLEDRVARQQIRLQKWRKFGQSLKPQKEQSTDISFNIKATSQLKPMFTQHQELTIAAVPPPQSLPQETSVQNEYQDIVASLRKDLDHMSDGSQMGNGILPQVRDQDVPNEYAKAFNPKSQDGVLPRGMREFSPSPTKERPVNRAFNGDSQDWKLRSGDASPHRATIRLSTNVRSEETEVLGTPRSEASDSAFSSPMPAQSTPSKQATTSSKRLPIETLIERTRQSMSLLALQPSSEAKPQRPKPEKRPSHSRTSTIPAYPVNPFDTPLPKPRMSITTSNFDPEAPIRQPLKSPSEKTNILSPFSGTGLRRSPSDFPSPQAELESSPSLPPNPVAQSSIRPQNSKPKPTMLSLPPSQAETEMANQASPNPTRTPSGANFFSEEADYASVFKSRPKIRTSGFSSPLRADMGAQSPGGSEGPGNGY